MSPWGLLQSTANRTDANGHFEVEVPILSSVGLPVGPWFTSHRPISRCQSLHVVGDAEADQPVEITLKPTRLVRARLFETPVDNPSDYLRWYAYAVDTTAGTLHFIDKIWAERGFLGEWQRRSARRSWLARSDTPA